MKSLSLLFIFLFSVSVQARPEIRFEREIEVSDRATYTWDDLVEVKNADESVLRRLRTTNWTSEDNLRASVRDWKLSEDQGKQSLFTIPSRIVLKKVSGYSSTEFRRKILNRLQSQCGECRFEIQSVQDSRVRLGSNWKIDESAVKISGSLLVPVSSEKETAWIPVKMRVSRMAAVLKRSVTLGQTLTSSDVEMLEVDVSHGRETPLKLEDLKDVAAARTMSAGQILFPSDIKKEELVKRGQTVKLFLGDADYEVSVSAVAEQPGRFGDIVRIKNVESGKVLSGQVVGSGEVRLQ
ncbi:MAG: flagellar basal body P-ring formation protein FlgA [Bdellovibrionaceae bacterium]|nr:flagellar basal body P-ring formation protein FlgA [Pseudobdellovibrionaceae bacterium]